MEVLERDISYSENIRRGRRDKTRRLAFPFRRRIKEERIAELEVEADGQVIGHCQGEFFKK